MSAIRLSLPEREALELLADLEKGHRSKDFGAIRDALGGLNGVQLWTDDPLLKASIQTVLRSWNHEVTVFQIAA